MHQRRAPVVSRERASIFDKPQKKATPIPNSSHGIDTAAAREAFNVTPWTYCNASAGSATFTTNALSTVGALSGKRPDSRNNIPAARHTNSRTMFAMASPPVFGVSRWGLSDRNAKLMRTRKADFARPMMWHYHCRDEWDVTAATPRDWRRSMRVQCDVNAGRNP